MNKKIVLLLAASVLTACGGGGSGGGSGGSSSSAAPQSYSVGGTVTGLNGTGLVLQNNAGNDLTVAANGAVTFSTSIASGSAYSVTVKTQPTATPAQTCSVTSGSGTVASAAVTNVAIACRNLVGKFLYVPNNGDGTISAFLINATTGALTAVGSPVVAGIGTAGLAVNPTGQFLYSSNAGNLGVGASLSGYSINSTTGALVPTPNSPYAAGASDSLPDTPFFQPAGQFVYVRKLITNGMFGYSVNASTGELTALAGTPLPVYSFPGRFNAANELYYTPDSSQVSGVAISVYSVNTTTGVGALSGSATTGTTMGFSAFDPSNRFVYFSGFGGNTVAGFSINATTGLLTAVSGSPAPVAPTGVVLRSPPIFHPSGKFVYFLGATPPGTVLSIYAVSVNTTTGALSPVTSGLSTGGTNIGAFFVHSSGKYLGVLNRAAPASFAIFGIDQVTGGLTPAVGSPFPLASIATPGAIMGDPSGQFFYITDTASNSITHFTFDANAGTITLGAAYPTGLTPRAGVITGLQ